MKGLPPRRRRRQSGFTLVTMVLLLALGTVSAMVVFDSVDEEQQLARMFRQSAETREAAEGGLMEILNDQDFSAQLPTLATQSLRATYAPDSTSKFSGPTTHRGDRTLNGSIELIRVAPMQESSYSIVRAVMYEVRVDALGSDGASSGVQAQVYKVASTQSGVILPRIHAR